ncbi:AMP nucleosidase [Salinisphaera sp. Q1T1-3]|uniref:AMP nucleosidase n=1 Tax=Salinisphaera sp. Q1T1-3 TaxID=2321229 RepID=UPI000E741F08|nr:AMP nucleosidase [Salinisphaera sp. Q1T1-3]RJS95083.1 AMP nucleosidase [Salinisphaera sp. Q1T1-3]
MPGTGHGNASALQAFDDADAALARIESLYARACAEIRDRHARFMAGERAPEPLPNAFYPYVGIEITSDRLSANARPTYGSLRKGGVHGTTVTQPALFRDYLAEQLRLLLVNHGGPIQVGLSDQPIPLPFVIEAATANLEPDGLRAMEQAFALPNLAFIDDSIANSSHRTLPGAPFPLALFDAPRTDLALQRLAHYTGTDPAYFQGFVLLTNYQRYVDDFRDHAARALCEDNEYTGFVGPGDEIVGRADGTGLSAGGAAPGHLPPMPAYHLTRADGLGVTLINIGMGPSNAKTITDHLAVLRPHCWLMIGHCGGLRRSQQLGDYVLAHGYVREDHVLDQDLPPWVPIPPIAEVQQALEHAVTNVTGLSNREMKDRLRTGTVASTDNRNWEFRFDELYERFSQSRAIAVDMESAAIATNGFRLRVPYGTLLCVSDKPMHGELKLRSMANAFYRTRVSQHLTIGLETVRLLRESGLEALHSRKLRSFDEPAFR